jgi:hypothetical protein
MTLIHGIDLSRWQKGLKISDLPASISFVNISLSKGLGAPPEIGATQHRQTWAADARGAGKMLFGYHWLNNSGSGLQQWLACKREALATFGTLEGWGLSLDCEDNATYQHVLDFVTAAKADLKRPIAFYTGDWWLDPRGWAPLAEKLPYLWGAANDGWLTSAPPDLSKHWRWTASGGWQHMSFVQWSASQTIAGVKVSSTVVRNPEVLCALTGKHLDLL